MHLRALQAGTEDEQSTMLLQYVDHVAPWAWDALPGALAATLTAALCDAEKAGGLVVGSNDDLQRSLEAVLTYVMGDDPCTRHVVVQCIYAVFV